MSVSQFISKRLQLNTDSHASRLPSNTIAVTGIAVSIVVMMLTISIVTGFKQEITSKIQGFSGQVSINAACYPGDYAETATTLTLNGQLSNVIEKSELFGQPQLTFNQPSILKTADDYEGIIIKGVKAESPTALFIERNIISKQPDKRLFDSGSIILSKHIADRLGLKSTDKIEATFFINGRVRIRRLSVDAIYDTNFADYDQLYAFSPIADIQSLNGTDSLTATQIDLSLKSHNPTAAQINNASLHLQQDMMHAVYTDSLQGAYTLSDITQTGATYYNWLSLLDTNVIVIIIIMIIVSGFTLISSLFIIILQRVRTIGLLKVLGMSIRDIQKIFIHTGYRLVGYGMLWGNLIAISAVVLQHSFHIIPLNPEAYYLDFVPVSTNIIPLILVNAGALAVSWIILVIPTLSIASISPSTTLRFE